MSVEVLPPDLTTPEGARKALADVVTAARELKGQNGALEAKLGTLSADLMTANKALAELTASHGEMSQGTDEANLRAYVREDGKVRAVGEVTAEDAWMPGLLDDVPTCRWQSDLQDAVQTRNLIRTVRGARMDGEGRRRTSPKMDRKIASMQKNAPASIKRAFGDISTSGAEWYPDVMMPVLERDLQAARMVAGLFRTMPMSAKNMLHPFLTTGLRPYLKSAVAGDDPSQYTSSSLTTAQRTIDAVGFAVRAQLDEEATEDSLIDAQTILREELLTAIRDGEEDAIINGDTTAAHQDTIASWNIRSRWGATGLGTAADHRRAWIGLRPRATDVSNTADGSGAETTAGFITARASLDSPHGVSGSLVCITSPEYYLVKMIGFAEVLTVDKFGPKATIFNGQLAALLGVPIVISEFVGADLNATTPGVFDNITTNKTGFLLLNRDRFWIGQRRGSMIEIDKDITRGVFNLVSTVRELFFTLDSSTKKNVRWNYKHSIT